MATVERPVEPTIEHPRAGLLDYATTTDHK
jgi:hypothetical protein